MAFLLDRPAGPQPADSRVEGDVLLIGRGTNAGLRLDDEAVALEHARIERNPAGYQLTDLGSVTGTYLNGKPLAGRVVSLKDGDTIEIGPYRLDAGWKAPGDALRLAVSL
ncbi:MAG TPA: FHA domain-containing protein, partial [Thermoanaerobaculia bacterium]|nr:FHA domain-containing protein [Thermoanaerobaculia bacterium]